MGSSCLSTSFTSSVHSCSFALTMPHSVGTHSAMSESQASTSTSSANAFPRPAGATMLVPEQYGRSTFSFEKKDTDAVGQRAQNYGSRRRTQYYEEQFAYKDATGSARERITKDSPVIAELRTNVIVCPWIYLFLPTPSRQFPFNYL